MADAKPATKILRCGGSRCVSPYQDQRYGKDNRVHNLRIRGGVSPKRTWDKKNGPGYACTVCNLTKPD